MNCLLLTFILLETLCVMLANGKDDCKQPHFFKCKNNRCISQFFVCDKEDDCGDRSDEENCDKTVAPKCRSNEFACRDRSRCIDPASHCDGKNDCLDGSDEQDCDGQPSAANDCNNTIGMYRCANGRCIALADVCNDYDDCEDGSDENTFECEIAREVCENTGSYCQQICSPTPKGPTCTCKLGYVLRQNGKCEDIDECLERGICSRICRNTIGSYYCDADHKSEDVEKISKASLTWAHSNVFILFVSCISSIVCTNFGLFVN